MSYQPRKHTHESTVAAGNTTISELSLERIDLEIAIDDLVRAFARKHPLVKLHIELKNIAGEPQTTVTLSL